MATAERLGAEEVDAARALELALKEGQTFSDIGRELLPHIQPRLAQMAIARALRAVMEPDAYAAIRDRNQETGATEGGFTMFPEGTDRDEALVRPCEAKSDWHSDELVALLRLALDPACFFVAGKHKGKTSWRVVAQRLNEQFADDRPMRNANACYRRYLRLTAETEDSAKASISQESGFSAKAQTD